MAVDVSAAAFTELQASRSGLASILRSTSDVETALSDFDARLSSHLSALSTVSDTVSPLQSHAVAARALRSRIDRAISPALALLQAFSLVRSLQRRLLRLSPSPSDPGTLIDYVDCVDRLHDAVAGVAADCDPAVQRLQEAVEFLSRTKATDRLRLRRLQETLTALQAIYADEVDALRYEGLLDEALVRLQDDYESLLLLLKHNALGESDGPDQFAQSTDGSDLAPLASPLQVQALRRISQTLATNDCLDIAIDIFVKVRYRRAAKALMRLSPEYLRTYAPEEIDAMGWAEVEAAITLWIRHLELAVQTLFALEKQLCRDVLGPLMDGVVWPECFAKIADRIMAVFFRFSEGVARSSKQPHKLFKLLDMFDALARIRPQLESTFDGEPGGDIRARFRELQKLVVHAAAKALWEFGLRIEGLQDAAEPSPGDGSVPKVVRHAVHYLKCLATARYAGPMERVLRTERNWREDPPSRPPVDDASDDGLLRDVARNILEALQRNVEAKRARCGKKDRALPHVMATNAYWYVHTRTRGTELAKLVGEETMRATFKNAAEQAAFAYQESAWGMLLSLVERDDAAAKAEQGKGKARARAKLEEFMRGFEVNMRKHRSLYGFRDADLRNQIREAVEKTVVPAYAEFLHANAAAIPVRAFLPPDSIRALIRQAFDAAEEGEEEEGKKPSSVPKPEGEKVPQRRERIRRGQERPPELGGSGSFGH
ncbi:exocyst complex component EXO70I-like [Zingiber officinale]|uniref:Exocyst subunit Exo70 family protein n=1 Tax=Zingiber officinale TaxID=94328 RepID=A0A8J5H790_ZINOF|nr:exocyst complex component EXO70I-like [Zingiber officinale]KAG6522159.1 hypothetical protein ZIOFF_019296 [Zingiber officinale]